jgi:hypothetical protein
VQGTALMLARYSAPLKAWIKQQGGLTEHEIQATGVQLIQLGYPNCTAG